MLVSGYGDTRPRFVVIVSQREVPFPCFCGKIDRVDYRFGSCESSPVQSKPNRTDFPFLLLFLSQVPSRTLPSFTWPNCSTGLGVDLVFAYLLFGL
ncbi:unnamed protein product [Soboliphyme baturini]|uniref:Uncharacterized protein n=1 Tax=Soboliphyme baturini TaxID=241478 RepID=A0A183ID62_9BILA|nr:unnamed protein product [Soboliphyme baturini]